MSNLMRRGVVAAPIVVALLAGGLPAYADRAETPAGPAKECPTRGAGDPVALTLVSSTSAEETSNGYTSRAKAWVYAEVDDPAQRCLVLKVKTPRVRTKQGQEASYWVRYDMASNSTSVLDSGEVLPDNHSRFSGRNGSGDRGA